MPYQSNSELPKAIRDVLPKEGQTIFREAFNSAYSQYDSDEETANRVAWTAVKKKFEKEGGEWKKRESKAMTEEVFRCLNVDINEQKFQELTDGGLLIKDVVLLAAGEWTDSAVRTPLVYSEKVLKECADNWKLDGVWPMHASPRERKATDKLGSVLNPHYDDGKSAVVGDVRLHGKTPESRNAIELVKAGELNGVSVEHFGKEMQIGDKVYAQTLSFLGMAFVEKGACSKCGIRNNSSDTMTGEEGNTEGEESGINYDAQIKELSEKVDGMVSPEDVEEVKTSIKELSDRVEELSKMQETVKELSENLDKSKKEIRKLAESEVFNTDGENGNDDDLSIPNVEGMKRLGTIVVGKGEIYRNI